mmetsp:Transcript_8701/g.20839  ORF Transcript_8701/g.20839 Transcript_8701/m.20839 type:complete len:244 (+) Transcript_8701:106-837(+)
MKLVSTAAFLLLISQHADAFSLENSRDGSTRMSSTQLNMADKRRVVVTGLGVVNGCGIGHEEFFQACLDGTSSVDTVKRFDASAMPCTIASEITDEQFDPKDFFTNPKNVKSNDRYTHLAVAAARQALQDAELGDTPETLEDADRIGVMVGTAFGGMETFEQQTLKLAKNPAKPKVREGDGIHGFFHEHKLKKADENCYCFRTRETTLSPAKLTNDLIIYFLSGFSIHNPCTVGKHSFWCDWY